MNTALENIIGMDAEGIDAVLAGMSPLDARILADTVERLLDSLEVDGGAQVFEAKLPNAVGGVADRHFKTMDSITSELETGKITLDQYNKKAHKAINDNFTDAYKMGKGKALDAGDVEYLRRATEEELGYARKFGEDVAGGSLRMPRQRRARMYGDTVEGVAWNGKVESFPDNSRIYWRLGDAEHCPDCIVLANSSPFTKRSLPTTPRAGGTLCRSNCRCRLEIRAGAMSRSERAEVGEYSAHRGESLAEMMEPPPPPSGLRLPRTERVDPKMLSEREYIDELRAEIDSNRRKVALAKTEKARKAAIVARKDANARLIEFLEQEKIYDVPMWSVDEVITEAHIGARAEVDIFRHGIDGESLSLLSEREVAALVRRYEKEIGEAFEGLGVYTTPKVTTTKKGIGKILEKGAEGEALTVEEQAAVRDFLNDIVEEQGLVVRTSEQREVIAKAKRANFPKSGNPKGFDVRSDMGEQTGLFHPSDGVIDLSSETATRASAFFEGEVHAQTIRGARTTVHEVVHSCTPKNPFDYLKGGLRLEEAGAEFLADRIMMEKFGLSLEKTWSGGQGYWEYIEEMLRRVEKAAIKSGVSADKATLSIIRGVSIVHDPKYGTGNFVKTTINDAVKEMHMAISDAYTKVYAKKHAKMLSWQEFARELGAAVEVPEAFLTGLTRKEAAAIRKKFKKEIEDSFERLIGYYENLPPPPPGSIMRPKLPI